MARFCHRCARVVDRGRPEGTPPRAPRAPWLVAGILIIAGLAWITLKGINRNAPAAIPDMANAGNTGPAGRGGPGARPPAGSPPDISTMSSRERFDRLYDRVMRAAVAGNAAEAQQFLPMALMAYAQVDTANADLRYHAGVLYAEAGRFPEALALADTILRENPGHLFGFMVRADVAERTRDPAALVRARAEFQQQYQRETSRTDRPEYLEHQPAIDQFNTMAGTGAP